MESSTYPNSKFIESTRMWVNVAAHTEKGHEVDAVIGGKRVTVCDKYWNIPCESHSKSYAGARGNPLSHVSHDRFRQPNDVRLHEQGIAATAVEI